MGFDGQQRTKAEKVGTAVVLSCACRTHYVLKLKHHAKIAN